MTQWFFYFREETSGPYSTDEVKKWISSSKSSLVKKTLIWGGTLAEWKNLDWWQSNYEDFTLDKVKLSSKPIWHYVYNEQSFGPLSRTQLIDAVKSLDNKSEVFVWKQGMKNWTPIFHCPDIMDEVGVSQRKHPRASIQGQVAIKTEAGTQIGALRSISAGGCGAQGLQNLSTGEPLQIKIKSDVFYAPINAHAEIRYISETGYAGMEFTHINSEEKAMIINYIRQIQNPDQTHTENENMIDDIFKKKIAS